MTTHARTARPWDPGVGSLGGATVGAMSPKKRRRRRCRSSRPRERQATVLHVADCSNHLLTNVSAHPVLQVLGYTRARVKEMICPETDSPVLRATGFCLRSRHAVSYLGGVDAEGPLLVVDGQVGGRGHCQLVVLQTPPASSPENRNDAALLPALSLRSPTTGVRSFQRHTINTAGFESDRRAQDAREDRAVICQPGQPQKPQFFFPKKIHQFDFLPSIVKTLYFGKPELRIDRAFLPPAPKSLDSLSTLVSSPQPLMFTADNGVRTVKPAHLTLNLLLLKSAGTRL
ncbi:hypothetical protein G7046_g5089 [Stylonectria norvegica]|nr:hypothetical protein G7046_g5089 [Stylonectria norvegica]